MYKSIKRTFDVIIALIGILVFFWLFPLVAAFIKLESKGPVIFKQQRLGLKGQPFNIYKFRSMCVNAEKQGTGVYSMKGDSRVTKIGRIIRSMSIDELPQLLNILKGEMSLIGPRPVLTYHPWPISQYSKRQRRMFDVRPGVTGWAQINGRKDVEWYKRIELNVWYVDNMSFFLDCKIFFITLFKVFSRVDNENKTATARVTDGVQFNVGRE